MHQENVTKLEQLSLKVREGVIRMATKGGCFLGASLSCVDIIVYLYERVLNFDFANPSMPQRDILLLSKGHDVPALYSYFAQKGMIEPERLNNHLHTNDAIYWHPNREIPGVEFYSGSLGHLLSVGMGIAYDMKLTGSSAKVYIIAGDGELNEGSMWEGMLVASALKLDNIVLVVDRNYFQANIGTENLIPLEPLQKKFESFGWNAQSVNGHNFEDLEEAIGTVLETEGLPSVVIAETVRGKGVPGIENRADRWFCNFTEEEITSLLHELHTGETSRINSETLVVR
ncbi:MAG: hypothetical protein AMXMBFR48_15780 [Ignavibacteriales bacterium]